MQNYIARSIQAILLTAALPVFGSDGSLVLSEIFPGIQEDKVQGAEEWIELFNPNDTEVSLSGLQISRFDTKRGDEAFRITLDTDRKVPGKSYVVLAKSKDLGLGICFDLPIVPVNMARFRLKASGIQFVCVEPKSGPKSCAQVSDSHRWPRGHSRHVRVPGATENQNLVAWYDTQCALKDAYFATPGLPNDACESNSAVFQSHVIPCASKPLVMSASSPIASDVTGHVTQEQEVTASESSMSPPKNDAGFEPLAAEKDEDSGEIAGDLELGGGKDVPPIDGQNSGMPAGVASLIELRILEVTASQGDVKVRFNASPKEPSVFSTLEIPRSISMGISTTEDGKLFFLVKHGISVQKMGDYTFTWNSKGIARGNYFVALREENGSSASRPVIFFKPVLTGDETADAKIEILSAVRSNLDTIKHNVAVTYRGRSNQAAYLSLYLRETGAEDVSLVSGLAASEGPSTINFLLPPSARGVEQFVFARFYSEEGISDSVPLKISDQPTLPARLARGCFCLQSTDADIPTFWLLPLCLLIAIASISIVSKT
jgi:hypothetical protein